MSLTVEGKSDKPLQAKKTRKRPNQRNNKKKPKNDGASKTDINEKEQKKETPNKDKFPGSDKSSQDKSNKNRKANASRKRERNRKKNESSKGFKLVIRLLPPNLKDSEFMEALNPSLAERELASFGVIDHYFKEGSISSKLFQKPIFSRAYFTFDTLEQLQIFGNKVRDIIFIDNKENVTKASLKVSPYVKKLGDSYKRRDGSGKNLEGTIENDEMFKTFLKSLELMDSKDDSPYSFNNISIFRPIEKELAREKEHQAIIEKKSRLALVKLAGNSEKTKKTKGSKETKEGEDADTKTKKKKKSKSKRRKEKEKKEKSKSQGPSNNKNVVILEEAGKKELQKRKKLQVQKENEILMKASRINSIANKKEKRKVQVKNYNPSNLDTKSDIPLRHQLIKILKRNET